MSVVTGARPSKPPDPTTARPRTALPDRAVVAAVTAASAVVASIVVVRHLGTKPLWRDEAVSVSVATRPVLRILSVLPHHDANAGLYYLLLHAWLRLGHSPAWARGFSALCFTATAAVVAWAGTRWRGWETGLALGLLVAFNPFLVYYGQETRPYALAVLLAACSTIALFASSDAETGGIRPAAPVYLVASIALIYADLFALLYVAFMALAVAAVHRLHHHCLPSVLKRCWWIIAGASLPLAIVMGVFERGQISWLARPTLGVLTTTITSMSGGWLGLEVTAVLAVVALLSAATRGSTARGSTAARGSAAARAHGGGVGPDASAAGRDHLIVVALAAACAGPPLVLWTIAQVTPVFIDRYVIGTALALVGLAAAGLAALRDRLAPLGPLARAVAPAILAGLLVIGGQRVARSEAAPFKVDNAPAVVSFIQQQAQGGDAVAYAGGGLRTVLEATPGGRSSTFPEDVALAPGGQASLQHDLYAREVRAPVLVTRLAAVWRIWLITDPGDQQFPQGGPFAQLKPLILADFKAGPTTPFGTIDVTLLTRMP